MSSRAAIIDAVRANKPAPRPLPDVPFFDEGRGDDLLGRFFAAFEAMGGTVLETVAADPLRQVHERVEKAGVVVSMVPEIAGNRIIPPLSSRGEASQGPRRARRGGVAGGGAAGEPGIHEHDDQDGLPAPPANRVVMDSGLSLRSPRNDGQETHSTADPAALADVDIAIVRAAFGIAETGSVALTERELGVNTLAYLAQHLIVVLDPADIVINLHHAYQRPEFNSARYTVFHTGPSATADIEGVLIRGAQGVRSLSVLPLSRGVA